MMWKHANRAAVTVLALCLTASACSDREDNGIMSPNGAANGAESATVVTYDQVDFLGNPLVSEVTIAKANHDAYNMTQPYNTATFLPQTAQFVTSFGRPAALAQLLGSVLYPDILIVDPSKDPATAGWLSWALSNGWGGRKLTDDVVDLGLTAIFSSFLNPTGALCQPFKLPLCTDNVSTNDVPFSNTFPYLASPH